MHLPRVIGDDGALPLIECPMSNQSRIEGSGHELDGVQVPCTTGREHKHYGCSESNEE